MSIFYHIILPKCTKYPLIVDSFEPLFAISENLIRSFDIFSAKCCNVIGDPHYYLYDGSDIHYQGVPCPYDLSSGFCAGKRFQVHAGNEHRYGNTNVAWLKYIEITYNGHKIRIERNRVIKVSLHYLYGYNWEIITEYQLSCIGLYCHRISNWMSQCQYCSLCIDCLKCFFIQCFVPIFILF